MGIETFCVTRVRGLFASGPSITFAFGKFLFERLQFVSIRVLVFMQKKHIGHMALLRTYL